MPGTVRLWRLGVAQRAAVGTGVRIAGGAERAAMTALTVTGLSKSFGGLRVTANVNLNVEPGERRLIIGPNGAGKTTLFNLITGELAPDSGSIALFGRDITACRAAGAPISAWRAPTRSSRCSRATPSCATSRWRCSGSRRLRWNPFIDLDRQGHFVERAPARRWQRVGLGHIAEPAAGADLLRRAPPRRDRHGAGAEPEGAAARRAVRRPLDRRAARRAATAAGHPARRHRS